MKKRIILTLVLSLALLISLIALADGTYTIVSATDSFVAPKGGSLTLQLSSATEDVTALTVSWVSSDTAVATVDAKGKVTGKTAGTAEISCVSKADQTVYASAEVQVVIEGRVLKA